MKKRLGLIVVLLILIGGSLLFYNELKEKKAYDEIYIQFIDHVELEYGMQADAKSFIESYNGEGLEYGPIDTDSVGEKTATYKIRYKDKVKEYNLVYKVVDTNKPSITLEKEKVELEENDTFKVSKYIKEVSDVVDGELKYRENPNSDAVNYYTYTSNVDTSKAGEYSAQIKAVDKNGNVTEKTIKATVKEKKQETPTTNNNTSSSYNPNFVIKKSKVVVINAGHQAKGNSAKESDGPNSSTLKAKVTSGATGVYSKVKESQINLDVALKLRDELQSRGYTVYMIRTTQNVNISNMERALKANGYEPAAVISIHCDSTDSSSVSGAHTIAIKKDNPYCAPLYSASSSLAKNVINEYCKATGIKNRGVSYRNDLTGLNWSTVPSIYIELGFLSNETEDKNLASDSFQNKCAKGIANGIDQYLK